VLIGIFDLDKFQAIVERAEHPVVVMSGPDYKDLEIVALPFTAEVQAKIQADVAARGLRGIAIAGILNGVPELEMPRALPEDIAFAIGAAHQRYIESRTSSVVTTA